MRSTAEILGHYLPLVQDSESKDYITIHSKRFSFLIDLILKSVNSKNGEGLSVMDIGPSFFTDVLSKNLPQAEIYTMGFAHAASRGGHFPEFIKIDPSKFHQFDLNKSDQKSEWISPPKMDVVIMGEVLEHLHTSPVHVLSFVRSFLKPGGLFILGTPNAVALEKRIHMLAGNNPYELIRLNKDNPGHFREYTVKELKELGEEAGLRMTDYETSNYFARFTNKGRLFDAVTNWLPQTFRTGINAVFTRD
ncbi:methyltransferase domain-containing protein [Cryomorphaceae bacterium 1068]|nr:methyltransferase domain-containing protein [Cryomorphaceae bacterium 1068]